VGHISSVPVVDFNDRPEFVVDAAVFPGSSGSPVFWWYEHPREVRFLGVISEVMVRHQRLETVDVKPSAHIAQMIGLGIVIKATAVRELVDEVLGRIRAGFVPSGGIELVELPARRDE
jgi:hypothetical protein